MQTGLLPIGAILGPQGLKGQFKVKPFTAAPHALAAYGSVSLEDGRQLTLEVTAVNAKGVTIVRAKGITSREAAESLRGMTLHIDRSCLPEPAEDEIYHADLLGAMLLRPDGTQIGKIIAMHNFGAGDIVEVKLADNTSVMLPFGRDRVTAIDLAAEKVWLDVPYGLLDDDGDE